MSHKSRVLLIDGDTLLYRAAAASQTTVDWGDGVVSTYGDAARGKQVLDNLVAQVLDSAKVREYRFAVSDRERRWRTLILPTYKSGRVTPKPIVFWELVAYAREVHGAQMVPWLEGDDLLGIWASGEYVGHPIWSIDKDLATVPGFLYRGDGRGELEISQDEAELNHLVLALAGDPVDGYSGCPKVGVKTARRLLESVPRAERWGALVARYQKAGLTEVDALQSARVARVVRAWEWNRKRAKGRTVQDVEFAEKTGVLLWRPGADLE